jgi:tetratricopeptide (TPR) repeat protein
MIRTVYPACVCSFLWCLLALSSVAQDRRQTPAAYAFHAAKRAVDLAKSGHCQEALPLLKKIARQIPDKDDKDKDLKRDTGFAGVRCAMFEDQPEAASGFLLSLNHDFPRDPDVLYLSVHTYSDLSARASAALANAAPSSHQALELNAETLEGQGKWDEAEKVYRRILKQNPNLTGIHYRVGRLLVSKPEFGPAAAEEAKKEFEQELKVDPSNAGAEYVLGEIAKQNQQWEGAIQHFSRATKLDAGFGDAFVGWGGSLVSSKEFSEAIAPLETGVKLQPGNPAAHYMLAIAYARSGRKQDGDREFAIHRRLTQKGAAGEPSESLPSPN